MKPKTQNTVFNWQLKDASLELYQYVPGTAELLPKHAHEDYQFGLSLDTNGGYCYRGSSYNVPAGSFSALHTGEVHTTTRKTTKIEVPRTFWMLYVKPRLFQAITLEVFQDSSSLPFFKSPIIKDRELRHLFIKFCQAAIANSKLERESLLQQWLILCVQRYADLGLAIKPVDKDSGRIELVKEYLEANIQKNISLEKLAQVSGLSPYYLNRLFRQEIGLPPHQYQIQKRISLAKALINKGIPLKKIARETGFVDQSHLTRHFKKFVQVTPGQYIAQK